MKFRRRWDRRPSMGPWVSASCFLAFAALAAWANRSPLADAVVFMALNLLAERAEGVL